MLYLTTAEFGKLCDSGGVNPLRPLGKNYPSSLWQSYYFKRLGARSIKIPFNVCNTSNPDQHYLIKVTELRADTNAVIDTTWSWWRQDRYKRYVDTVVSGTSTLAISFLPGEVIPFNSKQNFQKFVKS